MEVTIEVKENIVPPYREEKRKYKSFWGKELEELVCVPQIARHTWDVHLTLIPSEEERAIVLTYQLHNIVVQEPTTLRPARYQLYHYLADEPLIEKFATSQDAFQYVDKLKGEILPAIKSIIDHYGACAQKESFTI